VHRRSLDETTESSGDPTNVAVRVSPATSASWSEARAGSVAMVRSSPTNDMTRLRKIPRKIPLMLSTWSRKWNDSRLMSSEERKEKRQHGDFLGPMDAITSNHTSPTVASSSVGVNPYDAMSDSTSTRHAMGAAAAAGEAQRQRMMQRQDAPGHRLDHSPRDINEHDKSMSSRSRRADSRHAAQLLARLHNFGDDAVADITNGTASGMLFGHGLEES
jgi:hypothetical protein